MKLSTKGRYGLKAMFDLALYAGDTPVSLTQVAERQNISLSYLEQLILPLRRAGLVQSVRGAQGGYLLAKPADLITVGDILTIMEGSLAPSDCVADSQEESCIRAEHCVTRSVYERIKKSVDDIVNTVTLQDMIDDHKNLQALPIVLDLSPDEEGENL